MSAFEGFAPRGFSLDYRAVVARAGPKLFIAMEDYFAGPGMGAGQNARSILTVI